MELIAKGWSALKEVDRVIDYCELNDRRLIPLLRVIALNYTLFLFLSSQIAEIIVTILFYIAKKSCN